LIAAQISNIHPIAVLSHPHSGVNFRQLAVFDAVGKSRVRKQDLVVADADGFDPRGFSAQFDLHLEQKVQHSLWERTKTIRKLNFGLSDFGVAAQRSDAAVEFEPQFLVWDVAGWNLISKRQFDVDVKAGGFNSGFDR